MNPVSENVTQKALVVDDDPTVRLLARVTLERSGFVVEEAVSGDQPGIPSKLALPDTILRPDDAMGRAMEDEMRNEKGQALVEMHPTTDVSEENNRNR